MSRVVLAMSGGVDSSVAAHLLRQAGHEVIGLFMRHGQTAGEVCTADGAGQLVVPPSGGEPRVDSNASSPPEGGTTNGATDQRRRTGGSPVRAGELPALRVIHHKQGCCSASDAHDARRVADRLEIPFYALNFEDEFGAIMDYFADEYAAGRTPNPCVMCNNWLKFGKLAEYAKSVGADYIATGHYARVGPAADGSPAIYRGRDASKDQSYVLFGIQRSLLPQILFPVGDYEKPQIRELAREVGLRVADKKDSQEICFVTSGDYADFVRRRRRGLDLSGEIVTTTGEVVGRHEGLEGFTIGQRKGLGVAFGEPRYVVRLEPQTRRVVIGTRDELARDRILANRTNWLIDEPRAPLRCQVKIRYLSQPVWATVTALPGDRLQAELDEPKHGVAPGQALVCYDGDRVLGGGWME